MENIKKIAFYLIFGFFSACAADVDQTFTCERVDFAHESTPELPLMEFFAGDLEGFGEEDTYVTLHFETIATETYRVHRFWTMGLGSTVIISDVDLVFIPLGTPKTEGTPEPYDRNTEYPYIWHSNLGQLDRIRIAETQSWTCAPVE